MPLRRRYLETAESSKRELRDWRESSRYLAVFAVLILVCSGNSSFLIMVILALMLWEHALNSASTLVPFVGLATAVRTLCIEITIIRT